MSSGRPRVVLKMHFFVSCQIYVENKQLFLRLKQPFIKNEVRQSHASQKELVFHEIFVHWISFL